MGLCYCFWCFSTDLPHPCAILLSVLKTFFVHLTESLNTTRHSTSLLRLCEVSTQSYATVIYMPRSCKTVLLENNWQMFARWSNQSVFVTAHSSQYTPDWLLMDTQPHFTPKAISDFVKTLPLPKHISGSYLFITTRVSPKKVRETSLFRLCSFGDWSAQLLRNRAVLELPMPPDRPESFLLPHAHCCQRHA